MNLTKRRTVAMWIGVASFAPMTVAAVAFVVWLDAHAHWPFSRRSWPPSPLDDAWVWITALAIGLALALLSRRLMPEHWEGRRDQLTSPIDDEAHIAHVDEDRGRARPRANA